MTTNKKDVRENVKVWLICCNLLITLFYPFIYYYLLLNCGIVRRLLLKIFGIFVSGDRDSATITVMYLFGYLPPLAVFFLGFPMLRAIHSRNKRIICRILLFIITFMGIVWNFCSTGFVHYRLEQ